MSYGKRIDRVEDHMRMHLGEDLSLDQLADVAAFSRFHFHRVYFAMTGETAAEAVRRARMNEAAILLAMSVRPVSQVARAVGYSNVQSFARCFREAFGDSPAQVRRSGKVHNIMKKKKKECLLCLMLPHGFSRGLPWRRWRIVGHMLRLATGFAAWES
ncbi:MAG: helix-turn-helix transcriptional regulator [Rhodobacteraceae bacterium]|nr:helix-turn-helix transcriptional regulator [Paracoccaceae bacterium]